MFSRKQAFAIFLALGLVAPATGKSVITAAPTPCPPTEAPTLVPETTEYVQPTPSPESEVSSDAKTEYTEAPEAPDTPTVTPAPENDVSSTGAEDSLTPCPTTAAPGYESDVEGTGTEDSVTPCPTTAAPGYESDVEGTSTEDSVTPCPSKADKSDEDKEASDDTTYSSNDEDDAPEPTKKPDAAYEAQQLSANAAAVVSSGITVFVATQIALMLL